MTSQSPTTAQDSTHLHILRLLQDNPDLTQRELAQKLGISVSRLNYCLRALIDKGSVKIGNFSSSKNKFKYVYLLTPHGMTEKIALTAHFLQRKRAKYDALKVEIAALTSELDAVRRGGVPATPAGAGPV